MSQNLELDAVIFDYGNVLCAPQIPEDMDAIASACKLPRKKMEELYWKFRDSYDRGTFDADTYWTEIGKSAGTPFDPAQIQQCIHLDNQSWSRPSPSMVQWADAIISSGIKSAILSNMPAELRRYIVGNCEWLPNFDRHIFSCDINIIKPDKEIYLHCIELLQATPSRCLFIDDRMPNIEAAESAGMKALHYSSHTAAMEMIESQFPKFSSHISERSYR